MEKQCEPEIHVRLGSIHSEPRDQGQRVFEWHDPAGGVNCVCERVGEDYLLDFLGLVSYRVTGHSVVECLPNSGCDMNLVRHFLLNQVVPRCLGSRGFPVVHAGAVCLDDSSSVAFLGNTGCGKSTLVSSYLEAGAKVVSDDGILLEAKGDSVMVYGGMPGLRLLPDSIEAVFVGEGDFRPMVSASGKNQLGEDSKQHWSLGPHPLGALFLLESPGSGLPRQEVTVSPLDGAESLMSIVRHAFLLNPADRSALEHSFCGIGRIISRGVPCFRLAYPRRYESLAAVREAVASVLE